jgi:predicted ester cyclase
MAFDLDGMMDVWTDPPPSEEAAREAFARFYTDPVRINGAEVAVADLVRRARALHETFEGLGRDILHVCEAGDEVAVAFRLTGRQTGPWPTAAGDLPATGKELSLRVIDVLRLSGDRISEIWMVADELGTLAAHDLVRLQGH